MTEDTILTATATCGAITPVTEATVTAQKAAAVHLEGEESLLTAGQRRINLIWESTQAVITVLITAAMIYCSIKGIESKELNYAFVSIVTMYDVRTNHTKTGGVLTGEYRSR